MNRRVEKAVGVAATLATAAGGVGLAATAEDALKNTPSPIIQEQNPFGYAQGQRPDPKRDNPSPGVVFSQDTGRKDEGVVEPVYTHRSYLPFGSRKTLERVKKTHSFICKNLMLV